MTVDGLPDVEVLDVFVIDERGHLVTAEPGQVPPAATPRPDPAPTPPAPVAGLDTITPRRTDPVAASPGTGPPPVAIRTVGRRDVRRAVFVDPAVALDLLRHTDLLRGSAGLDIEPASCRIEGATLTWQGRLRTGPWRRSRAVEFSAHPSRSWVVTVLELRLRGRRRRRRTGPFLRAGLRATAAVGERLTRAATEAG